MKRVYIIHGWGGYPEEGCFPWLKKELEARGFQVFNPAMPNPLKPEVNAWVSFLNNLIESPDADTYLFGHSIGAQTILRYLENLPENTKVGGAVFLAGWVNLTDKAYEDAEDAEIAKPWLETPINWAKVKSGAKKFIAIFSDNDPLVPLTDSEIFKEKLSAKIIVENNKGHFSGSDGIDNLSFALEALLELSR